MPFLSRARPLAALCLALSLGAAPAFAHHDNPAEHAAEDASAPAGHASTTLGELTVENPWSRATPPMANVAAGYFTLRNAGETPGRLVGASSPAAERVEIHFMEMTNDVMTMREVPDGVEVPAGGEVDFAPGGYHLMLVGLKGPLVEGESVPLTLRFEEGSVDVSLAVGSIGAREGASSHGSH